MWTRSGHSRKVLDTRKTIPGLRVLDKYAVRCGGGENHRLDLSDGILIKNNHISLGGGIEKVLKPAPVNCAAKARPSTLKYAASTNCESALDNGAESLLLDNMIPSDVKKAVKMVHERGGKIPIEASGGICSTTFASMR